MTKVKLVSLFFLYFLIKLDVYAQVQSSKIYLPNEDSLAKRQQPTWFNDAKLGIFIHWGLYSVPAYAPPELDPGNVNNWEEFYKKNPYAEWYLNTMQFNQSPTQKYHIEKYGANFNYYDFIPLFNEKSKKWNPDTWASLFEQVGAKYVVITTKHHDGFLLWNSAVPYPNYSPTKHALSAERNIVGELSAAVRKKNIRFGVYYSGGLDWTFYKVPINDIWPNLFMSIPQTYAYGNYATAHFNELIDKFKPDILWNDINFPDKGDFVGMLAYYYYKVPEGIINDRWNAKNKKIYGFTTPEYQVLKDKTDYKWETCRGLGNSFGYNAIETDVHHISADKLIDMFVDIVSKNGNLLLNVGPDAEGNIPDLQASRLQKLGKWLSINGEAIFGTSSHTQAEGESNTQARIRFTRKGNDLYAVLLDPISVSKLIIKGLKANNTCKVSVLSQKNIPLKWSQTYEGIALDLPTKYENEYATTIKLEGYFK